MGSAQTECCNVCYGDGSNIRVWPPRPMPLAERRKTGRGTREQSCNRCNGTGRIRKFDKEWMKLLKSWDDMERANLRARYSI
jgi:hypothetical protein